MNLLTQTSKCNVSISWITVQSLWLLSLLFVNLHLLVQPRLINKDLQDVPGPLMTAAGAPSIPNLRIKMRHLQVVSVYSKSILSLSYCALIAPWRMSIKLNSWMGCMGVLPSKLSTLSVVSKADLCPPVHTNSITQGICLAVQLELGSASSQHRRNFSASYKTHSRKISTLVIFDWVSRFLLILGCRHQ